MQSRQGRRGVKRPRAEEGAEAEEEEVQLEEDAEIDPQHEEAALMQANRQLQAARPTAKEEAWRSLTRAEKQRLALAVKTLLEFQTSAEPSLTVLAFVETPATCACGMDEEDGGDLEVSIAALQSVGQPTAC